MTGTLHVLMPTYRPVGGIVKMFDYVVHARSLGYDVSVFCPEPMQPDLPVLSSEVFGSLVHDAGTRFTTKRRMDLGPDDLFFVSLPANFNLAWRQIPTGRSPERLINIMQNVRHVTPAWRQGEGARTLTRPAARISINEIVASVVEPWLDPRGLHRVVNLGHDLASFRHERTGGIGGPGRDRPLRVGYTTWKSDVGDRVAALMARQQGYEFRAIRETATWAELRELYVWADVFLSTPRREEGMYLPGLEAMAAGALVVTPDAGGNMAYCRPGENCLLVGFDAADDYRRALEDLASRTPEEVTRLRAAATGVTAGFELAAERRGFGRFLDELWERIRRFEDTTTTPPDPGGP